MSDAPGGGGDGGAGARPPAGGENGGAEDRKRPRPPSDEEEDEEEEGEGAGEEGPDEEAAAGRRLRPCRGPQGGPTDPPEVRYCSFSYTLAGGHFFYFCCLRPRCRTRSTPRETAETPPPSPGTAWRSRVGRCTQAHPKVFGGGARCEFSIARRFQRWSFLRTRARAAYYLRG